MAPALSYHPFRLVTSSSPHSRSDSRAAARQSVKVRARQNLFGFGNPDKPSEGEAGPGKSEKRKPSFFDYVPGAESLIPAVSVPSTSLFAGAARRKDPNTVFVAGATGQSGARIAQMLLRQGFAVRAGVSDLASAQELARVAATYKLISPEESKRLNAVESTFAEPESIAKSIGPATKAVVAIGPSENGPDAAVTTDDALRLVLAAQLSGVSHVVFIYDSTNLLSSDPSSASYNVFDGITTFFTNLFAKSLTLSQLLDRVVEETDVSYTLIKAAMAEDYDAEREYGVVISKEGSGVGENNKVAKSQIAKLVADVFSNTSVAENKVVEVSTSPSATSKSVSELFSAIPEDGRRKAYAEAVAKAKAEEEALTASERARDASEAAKKLEVEVKKLSEQEAEAAKKLKVEAKKLSVQEAEAASLAKEARAKVEAAGFTLENFLSRATDIGNGGVGGIGGDFSWEKLSSQFATAVSPKAGGILKAQIATIRGQAKARNLPPQKAVVKKPAPKTRPEQPAPKPNATQPEVRKVFGGLFKQETIYMDDD
ncbi:protein plastid transcriptionally active 16, chloroplastic [Iris pallida]|uniref:Protein plastid transcriptionally active 16, chloroplastic n=1 Tax=Iris pallida TaxID=29817 RepID=A0AAX6FS38_IRIPA|nr:protein plastid transcriptionally active 16, chloroplastic [Iris pallida]